MLCSEKEIIKALKNGEVVGIPTDTVYGFACLKEYSSKIYTLKKRDKNKKLITFISSIEDIGTLDEFNGKELELIASKYWPGNNTLIFYKKQKLISYRIPKNDNILSLLNSLDGTLLTTSANRSGQCPCLTEDEFLRSFPNIKLLEESKKVNKMNKPSNIYIITKEKVKKIR